MADLKIVPNKTIQKVLNQKNDTSTPSIANIQQSLAAKLSRVGGTGTTSVKNQLFPSSRKMRRALQAVQKRESK